MGRSGSGDLPRSSDGLLTERSCSVRVTEFTQTSGNNSKLTEMQTAELDKPTQTLVLTAPVDCPPAMQPTSQTVLPTIQTEQPPRPPVGLGGGVRPCLPLIQPVVRSNVPGSQPVRSTGFPEIENAEALLTDKLIETPAELIAGILHQGSKMVLASSSKAGKTWMLLDLAVSVASGQPWIKYTTVQGRVLFLNFEIQRAFMRSRLHDLKCKKVVGLSNLDVWNLRGHALEFEQLVGEVVRRTADRNYSLIILDPIYKAMIGGDENAAGTIGTLCNQLEQLAHQTGAAVAFAHHFPKGNQSKKTPMDRMSGSGVFARDADTIITLTEQETDDCYAMEFTLRNFKSQPPIVVGWDFPLLTFRDELDPQKLKGNGGRPEEVGGEELVELLAEKPLTTTEWLKAAVEAGIKRATFYRRKKELVKDDDVAIGLDKKWRAVDRETVDPAVVAADEPVGRTADIPPPLPMIEQAA